MTIVERALELVMNGSRIGLGSGRAARTFVEALGERVRNGRLHVYGVPTSDETERLAMKEDIPLLTLAQAGTLGLYGSLIGINAYHQPGVEAGKKAAASILALQGKVLAALAKAPQTAEQIATTAGVPEAAETVYFLLQHLAANGRARSNGTDAPGQTTFCKP
jgi:hypothetical protein